MILGSSVTTPFPSSSSAAPYRFPIKHSLPKLAPFSSSWNISCALQAPLSLSADSKLVEEFEVFDEDAIDSGVDAEVLAKMVLLGIRGNKVRSVVHTLNRVQDRAVSLASHLNASSIDAIAKECCRLVTCGQIEEAVELMEILTRNYFWLHFLFILLPFPSSVDPPHNLILYNLSLIYTYKFSFMINLPTFR